MAEEEIIPVATKRSRSVFWVLLAILVLIAVALAAYIPYTMQQHSIDRLNRQVSGLTDQLHAKNSSLPSQPSTTASTNTYSSARGVKIIIYAPAKDAMLTNPVAVIGEIPGNWSFEASFPILLKDATGTIIAHATAQVLGSWMTNQLVPFSAQLTYTDTPQGVGTLVLQKDNPSGLPANTDTLTVPVKFN